MANDQRTRPTGDDEGKDVIDSTGETIGIVSVVEDGTIHVETDPGLADSIKATLGWGDTEDTQTIDEQHVSEIDDAVRLAPEDHETTDIDDGGPGTMSADPDTGPTTEGAETDVDTDPTTDQNQAVDGDVSGDETAAEMDDAGDPTTARTTGEAGASEMTDEQISERSGDPATDEMGVPAGEDETADANERPPGVEDTSGRQDVQDPQTSDPRGGSDVQEPVPDEPRDAEDVRDTAEGIDPDDEPSTGEAATRGVEEEGTELGREESEDESR